MQPTEKDIADLQRLIESDEMPHNMTAENCLLGAMSLAQHRSVIPIVAARVDVDDFFSGDHQLIYSAIRDMYAEDEMIDALSLADRMKTEHQWTPKQCQYIYDLADSIPTTANTIYYARIVRNASIARQAIGIAKEAIDSFHKGKISDNISAAEAAFFELRSKCMEEDDMTSAKDAAIAAFQRIQQIEENSDDGPLKKTGLPSVDRIHKGLGPQQLIIVAGRPSMGKSSLAAQIIEEIGINYGEPVLLFSLEMSATECMSRMISMRARASVEPLDKGKLHNITKAIADLSQSNIKIYDKSDITPLKIRAIAAQKKAESNGLGLIVIDYLQLMRADIKCENRQLEVASMSRELKRISKDLDVPVLCLSQLNRGLEKRSDKRPLMSDLRDSGEIEQDADTIIFVHREDVYRHDVEDHDGLTEIIIGKQRSGPPGTARLRFVGNYTRFEEIYANDRY